MAEKISGRLQKDKRKKKIKDIRTVASHPDGALPTPQPVVACTEEVDGRYRQE